MVVLFFFFFSFSFSSVTFCTRVYNSHACMYTHIAWENKSCATLTCSGEKGEVRKEGKRMKEEKRLDTERCHRTRVATTLCNRSRAWKRGRLSMVALYGERCWWTPTRAQHHQHNPLPMYVMVRSTYTYHPSKTRAKERAV